MKAFQNEEFPSERAYATYFKYILQLLIVVSMVEHRPQNQETHIKFSQLLKKLL
jgi:hypothetical protein